MIINSLNVFPESLKAVIIQVNQFLLVVALAAMGLETSLKKMQQAGLKPLYLAFLSWLFIAIFSLTMIKVFY